MRTQHVPCAHERARAFTTTHALYGVTVGASAETERSEGLRRLRERGAWLWHAVCTAWGARFPRSFANLIRGEESVRNTSVKMRAYLAIASPRAERDHDHTNFRKVYCFTRYHACKFVFQPLKRVNCIFKGANVFAARGFKRKRRARVCVCVSRMYFPISSSSIINVCARARARRVQFPSNFCKQIFNAARQFNHGFSIK